eukprot:scaffold258_cov134-Isochrysis_galbana.AAC.3
MVQPVVEEMFATVHAAGSSLFGLFCSCSTSDSTPTPTSQVPRAYRVICPRLRFAWPLGQSDRSLPRPL